MLYYYYLFNYIILYVLFIMRRIYVLYYYYFMYLYIMPKILFFVAGKMNILFYVPLHPFFGLWFYAFFGFVQCSLRLAKVCESFGHVTFLR